MFRASARAVERGRAPSSSYRPRRRRRGPPDRDRGRAAQAAARVAGDGPAGRRSASVPTQVVEIVRPGRAVERGGSLLDTERRTARRDRRAGLPPNRLIWTNDNLVALQTLLDERDPDDAGLPLPGQGRPRLHRPAVHGEQRLPRGQRHRHRPRRRGGQSRRRRSRRSSRSSPTRTRGGRGSTASSRCCAARLELLKELLAPTGSIYVHLDWHAVHYVKVLMDEIFGYENFVNEIVWKRTISHSDCAKGQAHQRP